MSREQYRFASLEEIARYIDARAKERATRPPRGEVQRQRRREVILALTDTANLLRHTTLVLSRHGIQVEPNGDVNKLPLPFA